MLGADAGPSEPAGPVAGATEQWTATADPRALDNLARDALIAAPADGKAFVDDACAKRAVAETVSG